MRPRKYRRRTGAARTGLTTRLYICRYSINVVLESIGIAFLEDIFLGMERAWKRFTV